MIELKDVCRTFTVGDQQVAALRDINLKLDAAEYISIMGPSGSGKSTLLNLLGLLDRPTSGTYLLDNGNVTDLSDEQQANVRRDKIGFVFQSFHLVPRLTAAQNVELPMILAGIPAEERKARVQVLIRNYGLADRADHKPDQLSGGQRQRVAIARALVVNPKLVIADEPTANLDSENSRMVVDLMREMNRARKVTFVFTTHDQRLLDHVDRKILLRDGNIVSDEVMA